jgi:hypothetical protein
MSDSKKSDTDEECKTYDGGDVYRCYRKTSEETILMT